LLREVSLAGFPVRPVLFSFFHCFGSNFPMIGNRGLLHSFLTPFFSSRRFETSVFSCCKVFPPPSPMLGHADWGVYLVGVLFWNVFFFFQSCVLWCEEVRLTLDGLVVSFAALCILVFPRFSAVDCSPSFAVFSFFPKCSFSIPPYFILPLDPCGFALRESWCFFALQVHQVWFFSPLVAFFCPSPPLNPFSRAHRSLRSFGDPAGDFFLSVPFPSVG